MSSSTFNSKNEWKVLLVVGLVLVACEIAIRVRVRDFYDERHRAELPEIARALGDTRAPRIVFLGNSLTAKGIQIHSFEEQLHRHDLRIGGACKIRPDDTTLRHWHYVFERCFSRAARARGPECVIVTFVSDHLSDQVEPRWRRMALNAQGRQQVFEVLRRDISSLDDAAYFVAACSWQSLAQQPDIKSGVLRLIVPHYSSETQRLNTALRSKSKAKHQMEEPNGASTFTYGHLVQFIDMLKTKGCRGVFCLMPLPGRQSIDAKLVETIESNGMVFFDFRELRSRTEGHYPDGYHMDSIAADIYTRAVADALAERLPDVFAANGTSEAFVSGQ